MLAEFMRRRTVPTFAANLSFLWAELPFLERFGAAGAAGFSHVEYMFPYEHPADEVRGSLDAAGLKQALFNLPAGDWAAGDRGIAADPARVPEFRRGVEQAVAYADVLEVGQLNCLAGLARSGIDRDAHWTTLVGNVGYAARRLRETGRTLLVESVNTFDVPGFLLSTTVEALRLIDAVGEPNVRLQFDAYHVARMEGEPASLFTDLADRIGHVQIADNPGRHQPGTGTIDFAAFFGAVDDSGYAGAIGLEYIPTPDTAASLDWLERYGFALTERI
jgi:hydroxypyruvate isomerase